MPLPFVPERMLFMPKKFDPEVKDRAVGMVLDRVEETGSITKAVARGLRDGPTSEDLAELKRLRGEVKRLREENEIDPAEGRRFAPGLSVPARTAGAVSVLSRTEGGFGEDFAIAGNALARAHLNAPSTPTAPVARPVAYQPSGMELAARHMLLAMRAGDPNTRRGWVAVMQQLGRTVHALSEAAHARGELATARALHAAVIDAIEPATRDLVAVHAAAAADAPSIHDDDITMARRMADFNHAQGTHSFTPSSPHGTGYRGDGMDLGRSRGGRSM